MIAANSLKNGNVIKTDDNFFTVVGLQHVKPGKGHAYMKVKLKNLVKGNVVEKTFRAMEKVEDVYIDRKPMQYLYNNGDEYVFMDQESYEQISLSKDYIGDSVNLLKEGEILEIQFFKETPISVNMPTFVELKVTHTDPGIKGDTVSGALKPATLETGITINVPLFINEGDVIKVDTRENSYVERV